MVLKCRFLLPQRKNKQKHFSVMNDYYELDDIETQLYNQIYHSNIQPTDEELNVLCQEIIPNEAPRKPVSRYYEYAPIEMSGAMVQGTVPPCVFKYDFKERKRLLNMKRKKMGQARKAQRMVTKLKNGTLSGDVSYEKLYEAQKNATELMAKATKECIPLFRQMKLCCKKRNCRKSHKQDSRSASPAHRFDPQAPQGQKRQKSKQKNKAKVNKVQKKPQVQPTPANVKKVRKKQSSPKPKRPESSVPQIQIITLSDSDDDNCVLVLQKWPLLCVSDSEEEPRIKVEKPYERSESEKLSDDVIFIEPEPVKPVIISLDETEDSPPTDAKEPNETTPDSNDFLDNSNVELRENFNFGLHGSDFHTENFVKPTKPSNSEPDETESSTTSTTDLNPLKTVVFNEVEFPQEDIFSESNLETFSNLIMPNRNTSTPKRGENNLPERDLEDLPLNRSKTKAKDLPNLSPMVTQDEVVKEKKRKSNKSSNDDVIVPLKKKNKSKKKRNLIEEMANESEELNEKSDNNESVSSVTKKKKKKKKVSCSESLTETNDDLSDNSKVTEHHEIIENEDCIVIESEENGDLSDLIVVDEVNDPVVIHSDDSVLSVLVGEECNDLQLGIVENLTNIMENEEDNKFVRQRFEDYWSDDKDVFYHTMVNVEHFDVENVKKSMSNDPNLWQILDLDKSNLRIVSNKDKRCKRCSEFGHTALRCRAPNNGPARCRLCGHSGHYEPRCPNKICNQCGKAGDYSTQYCQNCFKWRNEQCKECGLTGHIFRNCPDLWRRYHSTTGDGPIVALQDSCLKPKEKLWCCGCARKGHLEHNCTHFHTFYPPSNPEIKSYEDVYKKSERKPQSPRNKNVQPKKQNVRPRNNQNQKSFTFVPPSMPPVIPPLIPPSPVPPPQNPTFNNPSLIPPLINPWLFPLANNLTQNYNMLAFHNFQNFPMAQIVPNPANKLIFQINNMVNQQNNAESFNKEQKNYRPTKGYRLFNSDTVHNIQQFLSSEFRKLSQIHIQLKKSELISLHKQTQWMESNRNSDVYFRRLNMILFGVYEMRMGKEHLNKLKQFKTIHPKSMLSKSKRLDLYESYNYIFGTDRHVEENYSQLLHSLIIS